MNIDYRTAKGPVRADNEDSLIIHEIGEYVIAAVADGMGGHECGQIASSMAVKSLVHHVEELISERADELDSRASREDGNNDREPFVRLLEEAFQRINRDIVRYSYENSVPVKGEASYAGMGTTLTCAVISRNRLYLAHIGDSRAYLVHGSSITRLTADHTYAAKLVREGRLTPEAASKHPGSHELVKWLGENRYISPDVSVYNIIYGDLLLLCTDGIYAVTDDSRILQCVRKHNDLKGGLDKLFENACLCGSDDNMTAILIHLRP